MRVQTYINFVNSQINIDYRQIFRSAEDMEMSRDNGKQRKKIDL